MRSDLLFALQVKAWERRLIPLELALEPVETPPRIRAAVMKAIAGDSPNSTTIWRNAALGGSVVAAALAAFIVVKALEKPTGPELSAARLVPTE